MADKKREESKEYVLKVAKEHDVKFLNLWFTDILGMLKSFSRFARTASSFSSRITASIFFTVIAPGR